jgi:hypothetical protein
MRETMGWAFTMVLVTLAMWKAIDLIVWHWPA